MKYKVGDLLLIKDIRFSSLSHLPLPLPPRPLPRLHPLLCLNNTLGIITEVEESSTEKYNGYIWYSQVDGKEYYFYEDEVDGEVIS